jgi:multicomponent Na+:H+ antiporter subunit D
LAGITIHVSATGSITTIPAEINLAFWLILLGFGLNAAFIPLHTWLPDSYPRATITGSVFMCVYTTKTGVYVLARYFPGLDFLVYMGITMCVFGVTMALLQNNTRKLLSYHIVSQVGYMVIGIGIGTALAVNGSIAHLFNHIFYKALLFMCIGSVIFMVGKQKLTELGGLAKYMPVTCICFIIASLSIAGVPGFNGFISKGMIVLAAIKEINPALELLLIFVTVGTLLSFVKLGYYTFFAENKEITAQESPLNMQLAMTLAAFVCVLIGVYPKLLYAILPYPEAAFDYKAYTAVKVVGTIQLFLFAGLVFMLARKSFAPKDALILDFDYFYRIGGRATAGSCEIISTVRVSIQEGVRRIKVSVVNFALSPRMSPKIRPLGIGAGWGTLFIFIFGLAYILAG